MKTINVDTPDGVVAMTGKCLESKLIWNKNVEHRYHIDDGLYSTKQIPTKHFKEIWLIASEEVKVSRFSTKDNEKYMLKEAE